MDAPTPLIVDEISSESNLNSPQLFDQYFEDLIHVGISIYSNNISVMPTAEQLEYLKSLKRISSIDMWSSNDIFGGKLLQHIQEVSGCTPTKENIKRFINYKVLQITRSQSEKEANACLGNYYHNKIVESGIDIQKLEWKIQTFKNTQENNNATNTSWMPTSHQLMCENDKCRLCGNTEKVTKVPASLYDVAVKHLQYYSEEFCNKEDPLLICAICKCSLNVILNFGKKVQNYQNSKRNPSSTLVISNVEHIHVPPPSPPASSLSSGDQHNEINNVDLDFSPSSVPSLPFTKALTEYDQFYEATDELNPFSEIENIMEIQINENQTPKVTSEDQTKELSVPPKTIDNLLSQCKDCSVSLLRLPIVFVPSDTESESDLEDNEEDDESDEDASFIPKKFKHENLLAVAPKVALEKEKSEEVDFEDDTEEFFVAKKLSPEIDSPKSPKIRVRNLLDLQ